MKMREELNSLMQILQTDEASLAWLKEKGYAPAGVFWVYLWHLMEREEISLELWNNPLGHTCNFKCGKFGDSKIGMGDMIQQLLQVMNELV